jgi:hypothetical protein
MSAVERHYRLCLLSIWLAGAATAIAVNHSAIIQFRFWDPDDVMRLLEVRDWLRGQSWFDLVQHRMNLPAGLSMHWSRLLDVPLAGLILSFEPFVGQRMAETIAAVAIPMFTLGATMSLVAGISRHRSGAGAGLLAAALCLLSIGTWYAMQPMRIDHHGYQILCGLGLAWALIAHEDRNGAIIAGLCAALWAHISLEGLAFTACASAWLGLLSVARPEQRWRLPFFLAALFVASALLYLAVHGISLIGRTFCDQMSPVHIATLAVAALLSFATLALRSRAIAPRIAALAMIAASCALLYRFWAPQCAAGPFGSLGPLGHDLWYVNVHEGMPLWRAPVEARFVWGVFPWVGLAGGAVSAFRSEKRWSGEWSYCALLAVATGIAWLVMRAGAFANLLAIPGAVGLILLMFDRTEAWLMPLRIAIRAGSLLLLSPLGAQSTSLLAMQDNPAPPTPAADRRCGQIDSFAALDSIAPTTVLAPLELGPTIVAGTHHYSVTGPYHRNPDALEDVLRFFTANEQAAHAIALRRNARLLVFCPIGGEMAAMAKFAPKGVAAQLLSGQPPSWLHPIRLPGTAGARIYQVTAG